MSLHKPLVAALMFLLAMPASADIIHTEKSLYRNILIAENGDEVCMKFSLRLRNSQNQSCMYRSQPERLVFDYTRMIMGALLVEPAPRRILIIGLGGGTLPMALHRLLPDSEIDNVEIDEAVVNMARRYFDFRETPQMRVHVRDGRLFIKQAIRQQKTYDLVILDAFNGDYIPEHLMTREFLGEVRALLSASGVVVANTFSSSALYAHESVTYASVFGPFFNVVGEDHRNRVVIAVNSGLPPEAQLKRNGEQLRTGLARVGVDPQWLLARFSRKADWDPDVKPLTDQYAPVNLLQSH